MSVLKNVNDAEFEKVFRENERLLHAIVNSFECCEYDFLLSKDDMFQEASIGLYEAYRTFEVSHGVKFTSYAYVVVRRRVGRYVREMRKTYEVERSFDKYEDLDRLGVLSVVNEPTLAYDVDSFEVTLTDLDRSIVKMRLEGLSYREIAEKLGITFKKVDNRMSAIKRFARKG